MQVFIFFLVTATLAVGLFAVPNTVGKLLEDLANLRGYKEGLLFHGHHGMYGCRGIASIRQEGSDGSEVTFDTSSSLLHPGRVLFPFGTNVWIAIPEPPKARVRDVERLGSMRGENEVDGSVLVETAEEHQRASTANANVSREVRREPCEGFAV